MADVIDTTIRYDADLSSAMTQVKALTAQIATLNAAFLSLDKTAQKTRADLSTAFMTNVGGIGNYTGKMVEMTSATDNFGKALQRNKLTMSQYFSEAYRGLTKQDSMMRQYARQQAKYMESITVPLGTGPGGKSIGAVITPTELDMRNMRTRMNLANQQFNTFRHLVNQGAQEMINFGKNTQWTGRQLTVGLTMPVLLFSSTFAKAFMAVDKEITRFAKVYGDLSNTNADATNRMKEQVIDLAKTISSQFGVAASDTAALAADIAATGKTGQELLDTVTQTNRLAVLGEVDRQDAMKATLAIQSAFKQNTSELADSINFLNAIENQTSTTLNDLVDAIPKAGPVIKGLGGSIKDLSVLMVAMKEGGIPAAEAANAIKSGMASLINPTKKAAETAKQFGVDLTGIVSANKGQLMPTLFALQSSLDGLSDFAKSRVIEEIFGKYQFARISALFNNLGKAGSQTQQAMELAGASTVQLAAIANKELKAYTESTTVRFQRMVETVKNQLLPLGQALLEGLIPVLEKVSGAIDSISNFMKNLPEPVKNFGKIIGGLALVAGPVLMLVGLFKQLVGNGIKAAMGIVSLGARLSGIKIGPLEHLDEAAAAANIQVGGLTKSFQSQELALSNLNKEMALYLGALRNAATVNPAMFGPPVGPRPPIRRATGGLVYYSDGSGGKVHGPGGPREDKIAALLSNGEYVIQASAVDKYGVGFMNNLNAKKMARGGIAGYSNGGSTRQLSHIAGGERLVPIESLMSDEKLTASKRRILQAELDKGITHVRTFNNLVVALDTDVNQNLRLKGVENQTLVQQLKEMDRWALMAKATGLSLQDLQPVVDALALEISRTGKAIMTDADMFRIVGSKLEQLTASGGPIGSAAAKLQALSKQYATFEYRRTDSNRPGRESIGAGVTGVGTYRSGKLGSKTSDKAFFDFELGRWRQLAFDGVRSIFVDVERGVHDGIIATGKAAKDAVKAHSPSQLAIDIFNKLGIDIGNGIVIGLEKAAQQLKSQREAIVTKYQDAMNIRTSLHGQYTAAGIRIAELEKQRATLPAVLPPPPRDPSDTLTQREIEAEKKYLAYKTKQNVIEQEIVALKQTRVDIEQKVAQLDKEMLADKAIIDDLVEKEKIIEQERVAALQSSSSLSSTPISRVPSRGVPSTAPSGYYGENSTRLEKAFEQEVRARNALAEILQKQAKYTSQRLIAEQQVGAIQAEIDKTRKDKSLNYVQQMEKIRELTAQKLKYEQEIAVATQQEAKFSNTINNFKEKLAQANKTIHSEQMKQIKEMEQVLQLTREEKAALRRIVTGYERAGDQQMLANAQVRAGGLLPTDGANEDNKSRRRGAIGGAGAMNAMFGLSTVLSTITMFGDQTSEASANLQKFSMALMGVTTTMMMIQGAGVGGLLGKAAGGVRGVGISLAARGMNAAGAGAAGIGSRLMTGAGGLLAAGGGVAPIAIGAAAITAAVTAYVLYKNAAEEARKRAVAAFADPAKSAEYFGKKIKSVKDAFKELNLKNVGVETGKIDQALRDAVKEDYAPLIEKIKYTTAEAGAKELGIAFNKMLLSGLSGEEAKAAIEAIALESGQRGAAALKLGMASNKFNADMTNEERISAIAAQFDPTKNTALQQSLITASESSSSMYLANLGKTFANPSQAETIGGTIGLSIRNGVLGTLTGGTPLGANIVSGILSSYAPDWIDPILSDQEKLTRESKRSADQISESYKESIDVTAEGLISLTEQMSQAFQLDPDAAIKALDEVAAAGRNVEGGFDPATIKTYLNEIDALSGQVLGAMIDSAGTGGEALSAEIMKGLAAGISPQEITNMLNQEGGLDKLKAEVQVRIDTKNAEIKINDLKNKLKEGLTGELDIKLKTGQRTYEDLQASLESYTKSRENDKQAAEDAFQAEQEGIQAGIDGMQKQVDAINKVTEKKREQSQEAIDALEKEKKQITESTDKYLDSIRKRSQADNFYANQRKANMSALGKLASGDVFGFLVDRQQMQADATQYAYDEEIKKIEENRDAQVGAIDDAIEKKNEEVKAFEKAQKKKTDALQEEIDKQQEVMNANDKTHQAQMKAFDAETQATTDSMNTKLRTISDKNAEIQDIIDNAKEGRLTSERDLNTDLGPIVAARYIQEQKELMRTIYLADVKTLGRDKAMEQLRTLFQEVFPTPPGGQKEGSAYTSAEILAYIGATDTPPQNRAQGGHITGPGGPTDDKIPAYLSNGEYVVRASSVKKYGKDFLDAVNTQRFATGGKVEPYQDVPDEGYVQSSTMPNKNNMSMGGIPVQYFSTGGWAKPVNTTYVNNGRTYQGENGGPHAEGWLSSMGGDDGVNDINAPAGTPFKSMFSGVVERIGDARRNTDMSSDPYYLPGWAVIDHGNGRKARYAHMHVSVSPGQNISAGQTVGIGALQLTPIYNPSTGKSRTMHYEHLHFAWMNIPQLIQREEGGYVPWLNSSGNPVFDGSPNDGSNSNGSNDSGNALSGVTNGTGWPSPTAWVNSIKRYGVDPILESDWDNPEWSDYPHAKMGGIRGHNARYVIMHHTSGDMPGTLDWLKDAQEPDWDMRHVKAAHALVTKEGKVHIIYAYPTYHAGKGGPFRDVPINSMNSWSYGIEHESSAGVNGKSQSLWDMTEPEVEAGAKVAAATLDIMGQPTSNVINHKDWTTRKNDTLKPIEFWREKIQAYRNSVGTAGGPTTTASTGPTIEFGSRLRNVQAYQSTESGNARTALASFISSPLLGKYNPGQTGSVTPSPNNPSPNNPNDGDSNDYSAERLSGRTLVSLIRKVGFTGDDIRTAYGVVWGESNGYRNTTHPNKARPGGLPVDSIDFGLFQINNVANKTVDGLGSIDFGSKIFDAVYNSTVAKYIKDERSKWKEYGYDGWLDWNAYKNRTDEYNKGLRDFDNNPSWNRYSYGGKVSGPGGPKDDMIPAMLSNGEYVIQASSVRRYGKDMMDQINAGMFGLGGMAKKFNMPRYALGGPVGQVPMRRDIDSETTITINANGITDPEVFAKKVVTVIERKQAQREHARMVRS